MTIAVVEPWRPSGWPSWSPMIGNCASAESIRSSRSASLPCEDEAEDRVAEQQQREDRDERVVGDDRGEVVALVVEELVDHREREAERRATRRCARSHLAHDCPGARHHGQRRRRTGPGIGQRRHLQADVSPDQDGPGDRTGAEPVAHPVERAVEDVGALLLGEERQLELLGHVGAGVDQPGDGDAEQGAAALLDQRPGGVEQPAAGLQPGRGGRRRARERRRAGRPGEVVEAQPQREGPADPLAAAQPPGDPVDQAGEQGVELVAGLAVPGPARSRSATRSSGAAGRPRPAAGRAGWPAPTGAGPAALPTAAVSSSSSRRGQLADGADAVGVQLGGGDRADAPQPLDRQRVQELRARRRAAPAAARRAC